MQGGVYLLTSIYTFRCIYLRQSPGRLPATETLFVDQISAAQANFETILSLLSSTFVIEDEDAMMHWMERILGDRKVREEMDGWRADWGRLVAEGKSGTALL